MTPRFLIVAALGVLLAGCAVLPKKNESATLAPACANQDFNVYFEGQTTELSPEARAVVDAASETVKGCTIAKVRIIGSTDVAGAEIINEEISKERARVLADYLETRVGWPRDKMELLATGERGAVTDEGLNVPMRRRTRVVVEAVTP